MTAGNFRSPQQPQQPEGFSPFALFVWALIFLGVFVTLGWNYGVSEIIQGYGGPDVNINVIEGMLVGMFVRVLSKR
jgi:hypothetical protein